MTHGARIVSKETVVKEIVGRIQSGSAARCRRRTARRQPQRQPPLVTKTKYNGRCLSKRGMLLRRRAGLRWQWGTIAAASPLGFVGSALPMGRIDYRRERGCAGAI